MEQQDPNKIKPASTTAPSVHATEPASRPSSKNKNKLMLLGAVGVAVVVAAVGWFVIAGKTSTDQASKETGDIVIGSNMEYTLPANAVFGPASKQGMEIALEEINAKGGILGRQVRGVYLDEGGSAVTSKKNIEQLINQDKAVAIVGPTSGSYFLEWLDLVQDNGVTLFAPAAPTTSLTHKFAQRPRNYVFRISANDQAAASFNVAWAIKSTNNGKIAIIADDQPYGTQGTKDLTEVLARWGKTPVVVSTFTRGSDATTLAANIRAARDAGADCIIIHSIATETAMLLRALELVQGYHPVLIGSSASLSAALPKGAGALAIKLVFPSWSGVDLNPKTKALSEKIATKYGKDATPVFAVAAQTYDAIYLLKAAIEKAGSTDRKDVRDALENTTGVEGIIKSYDKVFTKQQHEAITAADIYMIHFDGKGFSRIPAQESVGLEIR